MSKEAIKLLLEERASAWEEAKAILDAADAENRSMSGEEQEKWDRANETIDTLDKRAETLIEADKREQRAEEMRSEYESLIRPEGGSGEGEEQRHVQLNTEIREFLRGERRSLDITPEKSLTVTEMRALAKGSGTGGNIVPTTFHNQLFVHLIEMSAVLDAGATVWETDGGEPMEFPKTTGLSSSSQTAEAATIATSNPTFGKLTLGAYKYPVLTDITKELVEDESVDILPFLAEQAGWAVGNAWGAKLVNGSGSGEPQGIVTGASTGVTGAVGVAGVPTWDNLIDLFYSVIAPYRRRPGCGWLFEDQTAAILRKIKDGDGKYVWEPSVVVGQPDTILSKPVYNDPNVPTVAATAKSIIFGDISRYYARKVRGVRFERSDDFQFSADIVTFKTVIRGDGGVADATGAIKAFVGGAAS